MEHQSFGELVRAIESLGGRLDGTGAVYAACKLCKRTRRFAPERVGSLRLIGFLFCVECLSRLRLATTQADHQVLV